MVAAKSRAKQGFRVLDKSEVSGLKGGTDKKLRKEIEDYDAGFNGRLGQATKNLNIESITNYVLETGVLPGMNSAGIGSPEYQKSLEITLEQSKELETNIRELFLKGAHDEYYGLIERAVAYLFSRFGAQKKIKPWVNSRVEKREYESAMEWLNSHITVFQSEQEKYETQYASDSKKIETLRAEIMQNGFKLTVRKKTMEDLKSKIEEARKKQMSAVEKSGEDEKGSEEEVNGWSLKSFEYLTDLPKFQKDIMGLESGIETKWFQISQARVSRLIAYKNIMLFSKSALIFGEVYSRIKSVYEMAGTGNLESTLTSVAKGVLRFDPVQKNIDRISEKYSDLADALPETVYGLAATSDGLEDKAKDMFGSVSGTCEDDYKRAMNIVEEIRNSTF